MRRFNDRMPYSSNNDGGGGPWGGGGGNSGGGPQGPDLDALLRKGRDQLRVVLGGKGGGGGGRGDGPAMGRIWLFAVPLLLGLNRIK